MKVHLVDGTYELFRQYFGSKNRRAGSGDRDAPSSQSSSPSSSSPSSPSSPSTSAGGQLSEADLDLEATVGVLSSTLQLIADGATHIGVASDHVIESFRNELWAGYKTSEGMLPELLHQIPIMEQALVDMGVTVWPMVEWEADDALGAAAKIAAADERVEQVLIITPDKDLGQCVVGDRVVQYDRRKREIIDEAGVIAKFGIGPASIPDYLGLVGDTADGFPGLPGWGAKSAAAVLAVYGHIEQIPPEASLWEVPGLRGAAKLSNTLRSQLDDALLFRTIATVDVDAPVGAVDEWKWRGPTDRFEATCERLGVPGLARRAHELVSR